MSIEQWIFQYRLIEKHKSNESKLKIETIKAVLGESVDILKILFERNAEMVGFFANKEDYFKYMDKKKEHERAEGKQDSQELTEEESLERDFEYFMSDAFPDDLTIESTIPIPNAGVVKKTRKRMVGIQVRKE